jgi:hypothetical protein
LTGSRKVGRHHKLEGSLFDPAKSLVLVCVPQANVSVAFVTERRTLAGALRILKP